MSQLSAGTDATRVVAQAWFGALTTGDINAALGFLDPDVEFINYIPELGYNTDMAWIGTYRGPAAVLDSFKVFSAACEVRLEELVTLAVDGEEAMGVIREVSVVRDTGFSFEIEFVQRLTVRGGKIVRWKSYTDPSPIIRALRGDGAKGTAE